MGTSKSGKDSVPFVNQLVQNDPQEIKSALLECDAVVYRLKGTNIDDTRYAIKVLEAAEFNDTKTFILISSYMSWASTRKNTTEEEAQDEEGAATQNKQVRKPYEAFTEDAYVTRKPHPSFKGFVEIEKRVMRAKSKFLKTFVFFSGLLYGEEEDKLHQWFKLGWSCEGEALPVFLDGGNYIPLIHVKDLVSIIHKTIEEPPQPKDEGDDYQQSFFACDDSQLTQNQIVQCLSEKFGYGGKVEHLSEEDSLIYDHFDYFTADVKFAVGAIAEKQIEWVSKEGLIENIEKVKKEFETKRNLSPMRIVLLGPPGAGKSLHAQHLSRKYRLDVIDVPSVIADFQEHVKEKEQFYQNLVQEKKDRIEKAKQLRAQKQKERESLLANQQPNTEGEEGEETAPTEQPPEEEVPLEEEKEEEEEGSPIQVAKYNYEKLLAITQLKDGDRFSNKAITDMFRWKLSQPKHLNHGWIMDGFPKTIEQAKLLFTKPKGEDEEETKAVDDKLFPDFVITFKAKDSVLEDRLMNLKSPIPGHNDETGFRRRLQSFNKTNDINDLKNYLLGYFEETVTDKKRQCISKEIILDAERPEKEVLREMTDFLGKPHNYGPTQKEIEEKERKKQAREEERLMLEKQKQDEAAALKRKQADEREKILKSDAERLEEIRRQEKMMLEVKSQPLRMYLMENVIPVLTKGLIEVCQMQPEDPVDYLAEWLFRQVENSEKQY
ncbi:hypothetical protein FDP41_004752 [Naegleria fowleri]|uniref:Uncharacterized protein n=1 Tax=Naegleria fowleri TaxID=5763 RepID=A0A6A5BMC8_NAEFO|nr:uncharacterized protein FDP41_004752 [Naegleria fowleri]KAF0976076.1 hypothetical protein FDP41_004752 [Naegleria fowleri]